MKKISVFLSYLLIFFVLFVSFFKIKAASILDIVINEVAWMGTTASSNDEWIELYNNTSNSINLGGWILKTADGTPEIKLSGTISPNGFYLLERTDDSTIPQISADQIYTGALSNEGEDLRLYDKNNILIDGINCIKDTGGKCKKWFAGDNNTKQTMERKNPLVSGDQTENWATSQTAGGTPRQENTVKTQTITQSSSPSDSSSPQSPQQQPSSEQSSSPQSSTSSQETTKQESQTISSEANSSQNNNQTPTQNYSSNILLNEILPYPSNGPEWVELYNQGGETDLSGWQIDDTQDGSAPIFIPRGTKIQNQSYLVFKLNKNIFNNDGDTVRLLWPTGQVLHQVSYQKAPKGQGLSRKNNGQWQFSKTLTPGALNVFSSDSQSLNKTESGSINEIAGRKERLTASSQNENNIDTSKENEQAKNQIPLNLSAGIAGQSYSANIKKEGTNLFLMLIGIGILGGASGIILVKIKNKR